MMHYSKTFPKDLIRYNECFQIIKSFLSDNSFNVEDLKILSNQFSISLSDLQNELVELQSETVLIVPKELLPSDYQGGVKIDPTPLPLYYSYP